MFSKKFQPILAVFALVNALGFATKFYITNNSIKIDFILVVNMMLFLMSFFNFMRIRKLEASSANAMVRSVMVGTLIKMVVFAGAALVYATQKNGPVGISTLLISMGLYLIYTWLEIRWTNKKN